MMNRGVSDLRMVSPGPTSTLTLGDQRWLESTVSSTRRTSSCSERLADFQVRRDRYWAANPPPPHHRRSYRTKQSGAVSGAAYEVSQDGCWVMEIFASAADMCFVTDRYIFNLWTYEQLYECDMLPWVTLNAANRQQAYNQWQPDEQPDPCTSIESRSDRFFAMTSPNLHHNIGCHDDSDDEEPRSDYHSGCGRVSFHMCRPEQKHGISQEVQVIRASRYADSFDTAGRHWVYVLPPSPLQSVLSRGLTFTVPRPIIERIWVLAVSWPAYHVEEVPTHTDTVAMSVHPDWPFNMLRVRRHDRIAERTPTLTSDIVAVIPHMAFQEFPVNVDKGRSPGEFWKLAPGMKAKLIACGLFIEDYLEDTEGFITKSYSQDEASATYITLTSSKVMM